MSGALSFFDVEALFPDEASAEAWFRDQRWPDGVRCVACLSPNVAVRATRRPQPFRCRDCRKDFSVRVGTLMHGSKLPVRTWVLAMWMMSERTKGVSSHQMARELGITQKSAWHLGHRIRKAFGATVEGLRFGGPVEVDETWVGGRERNKHIDKRHTPWQDGKTSVIGALDRATDKLIARPLDHPHAETLTGFVQATTRYGARVFTDEHAGYNTLMLLGYPHSTVNHSRRNWANGETSTNRIESVWAILKRMHKGTFHQMSPRHLHRYCDELCGRHNHRPLSGIDRLTALALLMDGRRLTWKQLVR